MVYRKSLITVLVLMTIVGSTIFAEATGGPKVAGQPPLSKTVIMGNLVADPDLMYSSRPVTTGKEIVMSGPGQQAVQEAYDVFSKGGNFFDAALPLWWLTACLGGQFMPGTAPSVWYNAKEKRAAAHIGVGTAPALMTMDLVRNVHKLQYPPNEADMNGVGAWLRSNLIPLPDSMIAVLDRWGTMSWTQAMKGTYNAMANGIPMSTNFTNTARSMFKNKAQMSMPIYVETRAFWGQGGPNVQQGFPMKRPGAARIIRDMADAEQKALAAGKSRHEGLVAARDEFYMGGFAKAIDQFARDTGGYTRWADYAAYMGEWYEQERMPQTTFMGVDFFTDPPSTQGPMVVMVLNMLENFDLIKLGYNTPEYIHVLNACFELAMADRWQYFGDSRFVDVPYELFSKEYAKERVKLIDMNQRYPRVPTPGDPRKMKATLDGWKEWTLPPKVSGAPAANEMALAMIPDEMVTDTTHCGMIDAAGNVFGSTPSDPGPYVPGYGVGIAGRARQFIYDPAHPASLMPGKRPESTPCCFVASKDGHGYMEAGTVGGDDQVPCIVQVVLNYLVWGMDPQVAVDQPRFGTRNLISWFTPHIEGYYYPGQTNLSRGAPLQMNTALGVKDYPPPATIKALEAKGHKVSTIAWAGPGGAPTLTVRDPATGVIFGGAQGFGSQNMFSFGR